jgi:hypothetical protein
MMVSTKALVSKRCSNQCRSPAGFEPAPLVRRRVLRVDAGRVSTLRFAIRRLSEPLTALAGFTSSHEPLHGLSAHEAGHGSSSRPSCSEKSRCSFVLKVASGSSRTRQQAAIQVSLTGRGLSRTPGVRPCGAITGMTRGQTATIRAVGSDERLVGRNAVAHGDQGGVTGRSLSDIIAVHRSAPGRIRICATSLGGKPSRRPGRSRARSPARFGVSSLSSVSGRPHFVPRAAPRTA